MGLLRPWSHVPNTFLHYDDKMSFVERWYNSIYSIYEWIVRTFYFLPQQNKLAQKYFGHLGNLPTIEELSKNVSMIFINTHRSIQIPKPSMPTHVNVGGVHMKLPKSLPDDLQTFLDEAENGVIYFSFGSILKPSKMPIEKLQIILGKYCYFDLKNLVPNLGWCDWNICAGWHRFGQRTHLCKTTNHEFLF